MGGALRGGGFESEGRDQGICIATKLVKYVISLHEVSSRKTSTVICIR